MAKLPIIFLLLFPAGIFSYTDEAINIIVKSSTDATRYCIELATLPNGYTVNVSNFGWRKPYLASSSLDSCSVTALNQTYPTGFAPNTMLILYEHNCTMTEQAWNVQRAFGANISLMIITTQTDVNYELTYNTTAMPVSIAVVVFWSNDFRSMLQRFLNFDAIQVAIAYPPDDSRRVRPAALLMFGLVFLVLLGGNFWAADEFRKRIKGKKTPDPISRSSISSVATINSRRLSPQVLSRQNSVSPSEASEKSEPAVLPLTFCAVITIILFAVGWLLLIYFFPKVMIYVLQAMFSLGAFTSMTSCLNRLSRFAPILGYFRTSYHQFRKPCAFKLGPFNACNFLAIAVAGTVVIVWYIYRHSDWSWVLQDILGAAICITVTSIYRLGNMRVITFLLLAFFLYDIFFVFITPHIPFFHKASNDSGTVATTSASSSGGQVVYRQPGNNPSVMEQVALGVGGSGEVVPLLFSLPMLVPELESDPCAAPRRSMLGFGDVILPGVLLTFCKIFDVASENCFPVYYLQSLISYFSGLILTYVALYLMNTAQPALLYIVPCLLISTIITSLCRGELKELYTGKRIQAVLEGTPPSDSSPTVDAAGQGGYNPQRPSTIPIHVDGTGVVETV